MGSLKGTSAEWHWYKADFGIKGCQTPSRPILEPRNGGPVAANPKTNYLFRRVAGDGLIRDFTQVGIESAVPQPRGLGTKPACRKDLVIWGEPGGVTWDEHWAPTKVPVAIIEWKARRRRVAVPLALRAPKIAPADLVIERLLVVGPPVAHWVGGLLESGW